MKTGKHQETSRRQEKEDHGSVEGDVAKLSEGKPGDVIWTKLSGRTWWPGLVLDEDAVGRRNKRGKRSERDVLVRLYGSSKQVYVDPMKYRSEFGNILERNKGCYHDIFWESLKKELPDLESNGAEGAGNGQVDGPKLKETTTSNNEVAVSPRNSKKDGKQKKLKPDDAGNKTPMHHQGGNLGGESEEQTARRVKVMQTLGLVRPFGSPF
ncbi:unnamed protein product [Linum trigynum]|uniref:PWWP domain-containing protein n=1 Tax=Linum trigynum TaxID=586398 RepID=A0AAV2FAW8_9ROSI